ncbi:MAG: hypothetical protein RLZZ330_1213 [Actinomycetota bacterium]|jgi:hypothetical protein
MKYKFKEEMFNWRGPAPHYFVFLPEEISDEIKLLAKSFSYGWGAIPSKVTIGKSTWETAIFPKDGRYLVPIKKAIRFDENLEVGEIVEIDLELIAAV